MKKLFISTIIFTLLISFMLIPSGSVYGDPNLIKNGSFDNNLTDWGTGIYGTVYLDADFGNPKPSVKLGPSGSYFSQLFQDNIITSNKDLILSFDIYPTSEERIISIWLWFWQEDGPVVISKVIIPPKDKWYKFSMSLSQIFLDATGIQLQDFNRVDIKIQTHNTTEAYIDNISLAPLPIQTQPKPLSPQDWVLKDLNIDQLLALYGPTPEGFVKMLYDSILGRVSDPEGEAYWIGQIKSGAFSASQVVEHFIFSDELGAKINAMTNEEFITFLYSSFLSRQPDSEGFESWVSYMNSGVSKLDTLRAFLDNQEWFDICSMFNLWP